MDPTTQPFDDPLVPPRDEIATTIDAIYRHRMTTTSGGNLSILTPEGDIWITPSRVDKGQMTREDIVCVRPDGAVEGRHRPSSELPFHQAIYRAAPEVRGIVHAHPVALVAFSIARQLPRVRMFRQSHEVCQDVAMAPYALPGSERLGERIAESFAAGARCVILENHGVVVGGESLRHAFQRFETLEFTALTELAARGLGEPRQLSDHQLATAQNAARMPTSPTLLEVSTREKELRRELAHFVRRGYQQRLIISTEGTFSARLGSDDFLITPYRAHRSGLTAEQLVRVRQGLAHTSGRPSRAAALHRAIYRMHPWVGSIANAYPVHASAFSVVDAPLRSRTIPESYLFLRDVLRAPFGRAFDRPESIAQEIDRDHPVVLMDNDGVLVVGSEVLETFDRLEVLETTAEAILQASALGPIQPMPDEAIEELRQAFLKD